MHFPMYDSLTGRLIKQFFLSGSTYVAGEGVSDTTLDDYVYKDRAAQALVLQSLMVTNRFEQFEKLRLFSRVYPRGLLILDRYNESAIAYGMADGLSADFLRRIHEALPVPRHTFLLDISVEESFKRRPKRADQYESNKERRGTRELPWCVFGRPTVNALPHHRRNARAGGDHEGDRLDYRGG